jgi:archaetidylinositol phosphate synthase
MNGAWGICVNEDVMANPTPFRAAKRAQLSMLAPLEKRTLIWMAERMPRAVHSDHLTALGFLSLVAAGVSYWIASFNSVGLALVTVFLVLHWFGDSLDGTLARVRNCQRPRYGFYVDHILDSIGAFFLLAGLALSGFMSERIAVGLTIAYFLLNIEVYLATYTIGTFHLSFWKFSPTELRVLLAIGNVALFYKPVVMIAGQQFLLFDIGGLCGIAGMIAMLLWATVKHTIHLYQAEPLS